MFKVLLVSLTSLLSVTAECIQTHFHNIPGYYCPVYNPFINRVVPGPFIPFNIDPNDFVIQYSENVSTFHEWQLNNLDRHEEYINSLPGTLPFGITAAFDSHREWLEFYHTMELNHIDHING